MIDSGRPEEGYVVRVALQGKHRLVISGQTNVDELVGKELITKLA